MTTIKELELAMKAISRGAPQITVKAIAPPNLSIQSDLGPLTSKMEKDKTIAVAYMLNVLLGSQPERYSGMRAEIRAFAEELKSSKFILTSSFAAAQEQLSKRCSGYGIMSALENVTQSLKPEPSTPLWATVLDVTLSTALSGVPYVGPILASVSRGGIQAVNVNGILSNVLDVAAQPGFDTTLNAATKSPGSFMQMPGVAAENILGKIDTSKLTASALIIKYLAHSDNKKANKSINDSSFLMKFSSIINPITQNQTAYNKISFGHKINIQSTDIISAGIAVQNCLDSSSSTVNAYVQKLVQALELSGKLITKVVTSSVIDSFDECVKKYEDFFQRQQVVSNNPVFISNEDKSYKIALVIVAYYVRASLKDQGGSVGNKPGFFDFITRPLKLDETMKTLNLGGYLTANDSKIPKSQRSESIIQLKEQRKNMKLAYKDGIKHEEILRLSLTKAKSYVVIVKDSMIDTISKTLFAVDNSVFFEEIIGVFSACSVIVNAVWKSIAVHAQNSIFSESFKIPGEAVDLLARVGFIRTYSTTIGTVDKEQKMKYMGGATINNESNLLSYTDSNKKTATLRYYKGLFKGASDREKAMVYLFARAVINDLNLFHVFMGVVSWQSVKDNMHEVIADINIASHCVETNNMRPNR